MAIYKGLDKIKKYKEDREARAAAAEAGKVNWLTIEDGEAVKVWFLQELDSSAEGYSEEAGLGFLATEHVKPGKGNFGTKALCSMDDEEQCLGCEKHREDWKAGWSQKSRLYINVLVERKDGTREVAVMSQANGTKSVIAPMILDYAVENNTITDRWWKITRSGKEEKTTYTPFVYGPSTDVDITEYADKVYDLNRCVKEVPYDEQFEFFFGGDSAPKADEPEESSSAGKVDTEVDW